MRSIFQCRHRCIVWIVGLAVRPTNSHTLRPQELFHTVSRYIPYVKLCAAVCAHTHPIDV